VLRQAKCRSVTTGSDACSTSEGSSGPDSKVPGVPRRRRTIPSQQQHAGRVLQHLPQAGTSSGQAATVAAVGNVAPAKPAVHSASSAAKELTVHQPYSHLIWCEAQFQPPKYKVRIAHALCTDIRALQTVGGSVPVRFAFVKHSTDWDTKAYILEHPQQQQAAQALSYTASSSTGVFGPCQAKLTHRKDGHLDVTGLPPSRVIMQTLECDADPHVVVLQERVSPCSCHRHTTVCMGSLHEL
jgi:hypothetical protein